MKLLKLEILTYSPFWYCTPIFFKIWFTFFYKKRFCIRKVLSRPGSLSRELLRAGDELLRKTLNFRSLLSAAACVQLWRGIRGWSRLRRTMSVLRSARKMRQRWSALVSMGGTMSSSLVPVRNRLQVGGGWWLLVGRARELISEVGIFYHRVACAAYDRFARTRYVSAPQDLDRTRLLIIVSDCAAVSAPSRHWWKEGVVRARINERNITVGNRKLKWIDVELNKTIYSQGVDEYTFLKR